MLSRGSRQRVGCVAPWGPSPHCAIAAWPRATAQVLCECALQARGRWFWVCSVSLSCAWMCDPRCDPMHPWCNTGLCTACLRLAGSALTCHMLAPSAECSLMLRSVFFVGAGTSAASVQYMQRCCWHLLLCCVMLINVVVGLAGIFV